jgi:hypothetical protein
MFSLGFFQEKMPFLEGFPKMASFPCFLCRKIEKDVFQKNPKKIPSPLSTIRALHHSPIYRILDGFTDNATYVQVFKGLIEDGRLSPLLWGIYITVLFHNISLVSHTPVDSRDLFQKFEPGHTCFQLACHLYMPGLPADFTPDHLSLRSQQTLHRRRNLAETSCRNGNLAETVRILSKGFERLPKNDIKDFERLPKNVVFSLFSSLVEKIEKDVSPDHPRTPSRLPSETTRHPPLPSLTLYRRSPHPHQTS